MKIKTNFFLSTFFAISIFAHCNNTAKPNDFTLPFEKSNFKTTFTYDQTIDFAKKLAAFSAIIHYQEIGISPQGRAIPVLIMDKNKNFNITSIRKSGNAVLWVQANIHAGEPDGNDAGMLLLRDMAIKGQYKELLEHVTIVFLPVVNPDGLARFGPFNRINQNGPEQMGWRTTAQNLNLNRDFIKADAPEMHAWLKFFNTWLPDFFIDCHTTDGADYQYPITYSMEIWGNMDENLTQWQKNYYIPNITQAMQAKKLPIFPYVAFRNWFDPKSGIGMRASIGALSHGYVAYQNRPALLLETHMLKDYKTRVFATFEMIVETLKLLNKDYKNLIQLNQQADKYVQSNDFLKKPFALTYRTTNDSIVIDFLGMEYTIEKSDLTGADWVKYSKTPSTLKMNLFNNIVPENFVNLPEAYIIPVEWATIIEKMKLHGVEIKFLKTNTTLEVGVYRFTKHTFSKTPNEGRFTVTVETNETIENTEFSKGSAVIFLNQRAARIIAFALEPKSYDSFLRWGFFNIIFEQKEYAEPYVMEKKAREMLENDPLVKKEFEQKKAENPNFATNWYEILNWFYSKTPYWDKKFLVYPICKIYNTKQLENML